MNTFIEVNWENMEQFSLVPVEYRFVDSASVLPGEEAVGKKVVSSLDYYFKYHFPGNPIMPGVFAMEVLQQTGLLIITSLEEVQEKVMLFQGCKKMRLFHAIRPGDVLISNVTLLKFRLGIADFHGDLFIEEDDKKIKACSMDFTMVLPSQLCRVKNEKESN